MVLQEKAIEAKALPPNASARKAELAALERALTRSQGKRVNIRAGSKYAFGVAHAHGPIWNERGLLSAEGSPVKLGETTVKLSKSVQLPAEVAAMHRKAHQSENTKINVGNRLADQAAKEGIFLIVPNKHSNLPKHRPRYREQDDQSAKALNASKNPQGR